MSALSRGVAGLAAGWPVRQIAAGQFGALARLTAFLTIGSSVIVSLILMLPVSAYYQSADFTEAGFDLEVDGVITPTLEATLRSVATPGSTSTLVPIDPAAIHANGREASPAKVYFSPDPATIDNSWFRDTQVIEEVAPDDRDWIDLSADAARELGVSPGDTVTVPFLGSEVPFRVRRTMAIARFGIRNIGVGPLSTSMTQALAAAEYGATPGVMFLRTDAAVDAGTVRAMLASLPGGGKLQVQSRSTWLEQTRLEPMLAEPVRLAGTVLGLGALVGLALREGQALFERRRRVFATLMAVGATPERIVATATLVESVPVVLAMVTAWVITRQVAYRSVFAAALPPAFDAPLAAGLAMAGIAYLVAIALNASRRLRRHDILVALTTP